VPILVMMLLIGLFAAVWGFMACFLPERWDRLTETISFADRSSETGPRRRNPLMRVGQFAGGLVTCAVGCWFAYMAGSEIYLVLTGRRRFESWGEIVQKACHARAFAAGTQGYVAIPGRGVFPQIAELRKMLGFTLRLSTTCRRVIWRSSPEHLQCREGEWLPPAHICHPYPSRRLRVTT
jgi:hypothetical protein